MISKKTIENSLGESITESEYEKTVTGLSFKDYRDLQFYCETKQYDKIVEMIAEEQDKDDDRQEKQDLSAYDSGAEHSRDFAMQSHTNKRERTYTKKQDERDRLRGDESTDDDLGESASAGASSAGAVVSGPVSMGELKKRASGIYSGTKKTKSKSRKDKHGKDKN